MSKSVRVHQKRVSDHPAEPMHEIKLERHSDPFQLGFVDVFKLGFQNGDRRKTVPRARFIDTFALLLHHPVANSTPGKPTINPIDSGSSRWKRSILLRKNV